MKMVIRKIDRALKKLYQIKTPHAAEHFLIEAPMEGALYEAASPVLQGALYIKPENDDLSIGIYLDKSVKNRLRDFKKWHKKPWTGPQFNSFTTAAEEVSHFHFLLFHISYGRAVSQFELELQGEVDKFLLSYFANASKGSRKVFDGIFEQLFTNFRWAEDLTNEQKNRYRDANYFAKRFIRKLQPLLQSEDHQQKAFELLRLFYRQSCAERISFLNS